jgi:hypothetical protein
MIGDPRRNRFAVHWINHGYYASETFGNFDDAVRYACRKGPSEPFDFALAPKPLRPKVLVLRARGLHD